MEGRDSLDDENADSSIKRGSSSVPSSATIPIPMTPLQPPSREDRNNRTSPANTPALTFGQVIASSNAIAASVSVADDEYNEESIRQWKASPFAVGYTKPTWADEKSSCFQICSSCMAVEHSRHSYVYLTACCCQCLPVGRVGNLVVFRQRMVEYEPDYIDENDDIEGTDDDEESMVRTGVDSETQRSIATATVSGTGRRRRRRRMRPKLVCVVGPYFIITATLTIPVLLGLTFWTFYRTMWDVDDDDELHVAVIVTWAFSSFAMFLSLFKAACSDPGILYRHPRIPSSLRQRDAPQWRWNDQALTYRPPGARFDPEVQAVVEQFDHTCPWVGTAIGKGNMPWFQRFLIFLSISVVYDIVLLTYV